MPQKHSCNFGRSLQRPIITRVRPLENQVHFSMRRPLIFPIHVIPLSFSNFHSLMQIPCQLNILSSSLADHKFRTSDFYAQRSVNICLPSEFFSLLKNVFLILILLADPIIPSTKHEHISSIPLSFINKI